MSSPQERPGVSGCGTGPRCPSPLRRGSEREAPQAAEEKRLPQAQRGIPGTVPPAPGRHSRHRDPLASTLRAAVERDPQATRNPSGRGHSRLRCAGHAPSSGPGRAVAIVGPAGAAAGSGRADATCGPRPKVRGRGAGGQGPAGPGRVPRSADRAGPCRAAAALRAALDEGEERRRELERRAARSRALLWRW